MTDILDTLPSFEPGWVWLCGAGPGDPGLLTLHAYHALRSCDHLVYDALVDERCLDLVNPEASREYAGKRGGKPSALQADISARLVELARAGKRVLRLKGGDPFVFGRGGEEALALVEHDVPFRVIPGISAGLGGLAYAGIPLTHRQVNTAVTFITGHSMAGDVPDDIDWQALVKSAPVLVFYMGMKHLPEIVEQLRRAGRPDSEPVALVCNATLPSMQVLETSLSACVEDVAAAGLEPPAIIVVGDVVRLRAGLDWQGALDGRRLVANPLG